MYVCTSVYCMYVYMYAYVCSMYVSTISIITNTHVRLTAVRAVTAVTSVRSVTAERAAAGCYAPLFAVPPPICEACRRGFGC